MYISIVVFKRIIPETLVSFGGVLCTICFFIALKYKLYNGDLWYIFFSILILLIHLYWNRRFWLYPIKRFLYFVAFKTPITRTKFLEGFILFVISIAIVEYIIDLLITLEWQTIIFLIISRWTGLFGNYMSRTIGRYYVAKDWLSIIRFFVVLIFFFFFISYFFLNTIIFFLIYILPIPQTYFRYTYIYKLLAWWSS